MLHLEYNANKKGGSSDAAKLDTFITASHAILRGAKQKKSILLKSVQHKLTTLEAVIQYGFKQQDMEPWDEEEQRVVRNFLCELYRDALDVPTKCPYYYISHHILKKSKSETQVKKYIDKSFFKY